MGMLKRFFLLIVLFSFLAINFASAEITFNNTHPMPGETISFNGGLWIPSNGYYRVLIKEPSGRYILYPDYLSVHIKYNGRSSGSYKRYDINGTIKIGKDFVPGEYSLVFDFTYSLSDNIRQYKFTVGNYSSEWKYKTRFPGANWNKENFDDSSWRKGYMPFGDSRFFNVNSSWIYNKLYLRKEVYLDDNIQAWLRLFYEGYGTCWVNGVQVFSGESINGEGVGYCHKGGIKVYYLSEGRFVSSVDKHYYSSKIYFVDISKHLHPGKNVIACEFTKRDRMYYTCWGTGCHHRRYYSSRNYVDVTFAPLKRNDVIWNGYSTQEETYWYKPSFTPISVVRLYDCETTNYEHGTTPRFARVNNFNYNSWKWDNLDITDDTTFYHKPEHFNWNKDYIDRKIYWGYSPFNGKITYFRKWIWSDKDKYVVLKLSATNKLYCYINGKQTNFESYNNQYWNYYTPVKLYEGENLIACREKPSQFSIFDLTTSGFNGKLKVSNVSVENYDDGINLNVRLENLAHPEVQSLLVVDVDNNSYTKEISSAQTLNENVTQNIIIPYFQDWFRHITWIRYENVSYGNRVSDGDWDTYGYLGNGMSSMRIEKEYTLTPNLSLNELKLKYKFVGDSIVYFYNFGTDSFDNISYSKSEQKIFKVVSIQNATNYVSSDGKIKFRIDVKKGQFSHCYNWGCYITYSNAYYYDDEIYAKGTQTVYANFTKINSYANINMFIPLDSGNHNITVSAIDLIDNDTDIFSSNLSFVAGAAGKVGFLPFGGDSEGGKSAKTGGSSFVIAATSAIASASVAVAYLAKGKSASLKRLETSLSKAEKIVSRLQSYRSASIRSNRFSFFRMLSRKYAVFKKHIRERKAEEKRVEKIRKYLEWLKKQAKKRKKEWSSRVREELIAKLSGSNEEQIRQIDDFLSSHDLEYEDAKALLSEREDLFGNIFGISGSDVKGLVKKFAKEIGLTNYVHLGRWADQLRLIIDDPRLRSKFEDFLEEQDYTPTDDSNSDDESSVYNDGYENTNEENNENYSWFDRFTGALGGLAKYLKLSFENLISEFKDIGSSLLEGDIVTAFNKWFNYSKEDLHSLAEVVKNNHKEIILSMVAGLVAGAIITMTGGLGTPLALAISAAILSAGVVQLGRKYSEPLNELNNAETDEEIKVAYENLRRMISGDVIVIATGVLSAGFGGYLSEGMSVNSGEFNYEISTPEGLTVEIPKTSIAEMENGISSYWSYPEDWINPYDVTYPISTLDELVIAGIPSERAEEIFNFGFNNIKIVRDLDSPLAVTRDGGTLLINPSKVNSLSDKAFDFGLLHEKSELIKIEIINEGKILSDNAIWNKVNKLELPSEMKQELYEVITDRLIADKITLKNHPEALEGWADESSELINDLDTYDTLLPVSDRDLIDLAYLKALAPDIAIVSKVDDILSTFDEFVLNRFNKIYNLMKLVIKNV